MPAPTYLPPPSPASTQPLPPALPLAQECSLCRTPWYPEHPSDCTAQVFTEQQLAEHLTEALAPYLADAYAQGATDALHRLKSSLGPEHADLVTALLQDYGA